jgi:hypothetical protein
MRFGLNKVEYNCSLTFLLAGFDRPRFAALSLKKGLLVCVFATCQIAIRGHSNLLFSNISNTSDRSNKGTIGKIMSSSFFLLPHLHSLAPKPGVLCMQV